MIDKLLDEMRSVPPDRSLHQLEPLVWERISALQQGNAIWRLRAVAAGALLSLGLIAGGQLAAASPASDMAPFSVHSSLAPSTLLAGGM